jgi:hypothetical protein
MSTKRVLVKASSDEVLLDFAEKLKALQEEARYKSKFIEKQHNDMVSKFRQASLDIWAKAEPYIIEKYYPEYKKDEAFELSFEEDALYVHTGHTDSKSGDFLSFLKTLVKGLEK